MVPKRESINIPGVSHRQPIPMGSKIGNVVWSSPIPPEDPDRGGTPEEPDAQAVALFKNIRAFAEACGGTPENIILVTLIMYDDKHREHLNKEWVKMFPDERSRPARQVQRTPRQIGQALFHANVFLVLE